MYSCVNPEEIAKYDILEDKKCQNFIGSYSCFDNLSMIDEKPKFSNKLTESDREFILSGIDGILTPEHCDKIWKMIWERYKIYENL